MSAAPDRLSRSQARRLALGAQGFATKRPPGRVDRRHLRSVMNRLHLLQLDSVPVIMRTQYMPLYSRLGAYRPELLDRIAYGDDEWFEAWSHEASLLPVETEPLLRWDKERARAGGTWKNLVELAEREPRYIDEVLAQVTEQGPLSARELDDPRPQSGDWWGSRSLGTWALDWLFRIGEVGIRRFGNFEKRFDLLDNIVPPAIRALPTPTVEDAHRQLIERAAMAHGVGNARCLADYFRLPIRTSRLRIAELVEDGLLIETSVQGWDTPAWRHVDAKLPRWIKARALLSPFDPVVWQRDRGEALFDFEYRLEIYTPAAKRRWGYYVLPFLLGDQIVGRVDLKNDRSTNTLLVQASWAEPGVDHQRVGNELATELRSLATFVGADQIHVSERGDLSSAVRAAISAAP